MWEQCDKSHYYHLKDEKKGQIYNDSFYVKIQDLCKDKSNKYFLEIGAWNGLGSTKAFVDSLSPRSDSYTFYSLECNYEKWNDVKNMYGHHDTNKIKILNDVIFNNIPDNFYEIFPECNDNPTCKLWNDVDLFNMKQCNLFLERNDLPNMFDVVLFDGGEFVTYFEFQILKDRTKYVLLNDINASKCRKIVNEIKSDPETWEIIEENNNVRDGFMICKNKNIMDTYLDFIWSKGIYNRSNYMTKYTDCPSSDEEIINQIKKQKGQIWIRNNPNDIKIFAKNIDHISSNVVLITSDGDSSVPSSFDLNDINKILNSQKIIKWLAQNYDETIHHNKLNHYPIGLDLHTVEWRVGNSTQDKINYYKQIRDSKSEYVLDKIFCDSHIRLTTDERIKMYEAIKNNNNIIFLKSSMNFRDIVNEYRKYKFVISPRGNGIDCHRTWELFLLGCIVITVTSPLDQMFINHKLPVVILNKWEELNDENIQCKLKEYYDMYNKFTVKDHIYKIFTNKYWISYG